jgi:hypothetical protein
MRRGILLVLLGGALLGLGGAALLVRARLARCASVPLLAADRLPAPDFARLQADARSGPGVPPLPAGWSAPARGVQIGGFTVIGTGHSFQLIGIANALQAPPLDVWPGESYCVAAQALADSTSGTRLRVQFDWRDAQGRTVATDAGMWQAVRRWEGVSDQGAWSTIVAGFPAPAGAAELAISFHPASDDRVYLDAIHVRRTIGLNLSRDDRNGQRTTDNGQHSVVVQPWPNGYRAAVSFSFDWETAMGGLIHSRSRSDDPNSGQNALDRAMRMRAGVTTTLDLFRPDGIRATYYATGYNFLLGNTEKRQFMGNPTFAWATQQNRWLDDTWTHTPWFADDPYGTVQTDPAWYFGDLVPPLQRAGQDIQSHTFSHMDGGLAGAATWRADMAAWNDVAAGRGVAGARSLAFPWSSSAGMSYANWDELEQAGISSVTRTNWTQDQYDLFGRDAQGFTVAPHCIPLPGHERILACPDFYLTAQRAALALKQLDTAIAGGGMIDIWAHTEEVVSPEQIAAWRQVVSYAAGQRDAGALWIAPLAEIADWQAATAELRIENEELRNPSDASMLSFSVHNASQRDLSGVTLKLPFQPKKMTVDGMILDSQLSMLNLNIRAGQTVEVIAWSA